MKGYECAFQGFDYRALFFCQQAFAAQVQGLYETEVIAKSHSTGDRDIAIKEALTLVLNRILAGGNSLHDPAVQAALADASHYVRQYQYSLEAGLNLYKVNFEGNRSVFEDVVGIGRVLNPQGRDNTGNSELDYRLLPQRLISP
jgi:hypothetical protein